MEGNKKVKANNKQVVKRTFREVPTEEMRRVRMRLTHEDDRLFKEALAAVGISQQQAFETWVHEFIEKHHPDNTL